MLHGEVTLQEWPAYMVEPLLLRLVMRHFRLLLSATRVPLLSVPSTSTSSDLARVLEAAGVRCVCVFLFWQDEGHVLAWLACQ